MEKKSARKIQLSAIVFLITGIFAILLLTNFLGTTTLTAHAASSIAPQTLSQMTNEECVEFVIENGVEIPE